MLKGVNRNVIVVNSDKNSRFETVYFVLRRGNVYDKTDILKEANRIICDVGMVKKRAAGHAFNGSSFALGALLGGLLGAVACIVAAIC